MSRKTWAKLNALRILADITPCYRSSTLSKRKKQKRERGEKRKAIEIRQEGEAATEGEVSLATWSRMQLILTLCNKDAADEVWVIVGAVLGEMQDEADDIHNLVNELERSQHSIVDRQDLPRCMVVICYHKWYA